MHSESSKIVLTGIVVSAVAIAAYVTHAAKPWLSTDEFGAAREDAPVHPTRGDTISGSVISGPAASRGDAANATGRAAPAATVAASLQAARDSLQRNDLAAAQTQLDAARASHQDDAQVRALQREVQARADTAPRAAPLERTGKAVQPAARQARTSSSSIRHTRSRESPVVSREAADDAANHARSQAALDKLVAGIDSHSAPNPRPVATGGAPAVSRTPTVAVALRPPQSASASSASVVALTQPAPQAPPIASTASTASTASKPPTALAASTPPTPPARPQAELTAQTTVLPAPVVQSASSADTLVKTDGGPKTRAQVRAEIERARANGSLPAFGNPDPAGPGGAPSLTGAPRP